MANEISGTVTGPDGNPTTGAEVTILHEGSDYSTTLQTDSNGEFGLDPYDVALSGEWHIIAKYDDGSNLYNALSQPWVQASLTNLYSEGTYEDNWQSSESIEDATTDISKKADHLRIYIDPNSQSTNYAEWSTIDTVDLSTINQIEVDWENQGEPEASSRVAAASSGTRFDGAWSRRTDTHDVSGVNGEETVSLYSQSDYTTQDATDLRVYSVDLME